MANSVNAGTNELKRANFGSSWSSGKQSMKVAGASRRSNVATSPRRDAPTSWVNQCNSQQAATSRRLNVATSARDFSPPSLKAAGVQNSRRGEAYELGHGILEQQRHQLRRSARDLYCFPFLDIRMMFLRLNTYIFLFSMF